MSAAKSKDTSRESYARKTLLDMLKRTKAILESMPSVRFDDDVAKITTALVSSSQGTLKPAGANIPKIYSIVDEAKVLYIPDGAKVTEIEMSRSLLGTASISLYLDASSRLHFDYDNVVDLLAVLATTGLIDYVSHFVDAEGKPSTHLASLSRIYKRVASSNIVDQLASDEKLKNELNRVLTHKFPISMKIGVLVNLEGYGRIPAWFDIDPYRGDMKLFIDRAVDDPSYSRDGHVYLYLCSELSKWRRHREKPLVSLHTVANSWVFKTVRRFVLRDLKPLAEKYRENFMISYLAVKAYAELL